VKEPRKDTSGKQASGLGELLTLGLKATDPWTPAELEAALADQISMPMEFELSRLDPEQEQYLRRKAAAHGLLLKSLLDLFMHPHPPLELLIMVKDFFKANATSPKAGSPPEVHQVLYYESIAVAWLRHQHRISSLSDAELREGFSWLQQQDWVPEDLKELVKQASRGLHLSDDSPQQT